MSPVPCLVSHVSCLLSQIPFRCIMVKDMSPLPDLATHQQLVGFAMPEWMVSPVPRSFRPIAVPNTDPLAAVMPKDVNMIQANTAFESLIQMGITINQRADENVGKQGRSRRQLADQYWFSYLETLPRQEQNSILWAARSSPRYTITIDLYQNLPDKGNALAQAMAEEVEVFTRIDRYLALAIITDIADDLTKQKKQKKKIPPEQILAEILAQKELDAKSIKTLFALAKKTPLFEKRKKPSSPSKNFYKIYQN